MVNAQIWNTRPVSPPGGTQPGVTVSATNTYYSDPWTARDSAGYSLSQFATGTMTGTFTLWATDKRNPDLTSDTDWVQDTTFAPTNPAGSTVKFLDSASNMPGLKKRLKYVNASGTGVLLGYVSANANA